MKQKLKCMRTNKTLNWGLQGVSAHPPECIFRLRGRPQSSCTLRLGLNSTSLSPALWCQLSLPYRVLLVIWPPMSGCKVPSPPLELRAASTRSAARAPPRHNKDQSASTDNINKYDVKTVPRNKFSVRLWVQNLVDVRQQPWAPQRCVSLRGSRLTEKVVEEVELLGIIDAEDTEDSTEAELLLLEH